MTTITDLLICYESQIYNTGTISLSRLFGEKYCNFDFVSQVSFVSKWLWVDFEILRYLLCILM